MSITQPLPRVAVPPAPVAPVSRPRRIPRWWRDVSVAAMWLVLLFVVVLWVSNGGVQDLTGGQFLMSTGRLSGLIASALLLIQVFLMARVPWIEKAWGQDELARLHRIVGFTSFNLMIAHILLITPAYSSTSPVDVVKQAWTFLVDYPDMMLAYVGAAALCMVVVTSVRKARRKLKYESWHLLHLYAYLGVGLALPHQLWTGQEFMKSTAATIFWWTLYAVCAGAVLVFRVGVPAWNAVRYPLRVMSVRHEARNVVSVVVAGRGAHRLHAQGGQFFNWRFAGKGRTRANPYSLSAAPQGDTLRFTAAMVGDGSARLATLRPGTRVFVEGPYGRLHAGVREQRKVLLMGAGIGITPMRALLESLPAAPGEVMIVHRVGSTDELVLSEEIQQLADQRGTTYTYVAGHRVPGRDSWMPAHAAHLSDADGLRDLCPDVAQRDVFICGAPAWMDAVVAAAKAAGVPDEHIHLERFEC